MSTPVRFPNGITDRARPNIFSDLELLDQTRYAIYFVDGFNSDFRATDWTVTETDAASTQALVAQTGTTVHGVIALTQGGASANAVNSIQATLTSFYLSDTSKKWILLGRISRDNADTAIGFGMQATNTTPFTLANAIWAEIPASSTSANFKLAKSSSVTTATVTNAYTSSSLTNYITLGMVHSRGVVRYFVNGVQRGQITNLTNWPNAASLLPTISNQNTTAGVRNMYIDYFLFAVER
jgi:hypothetical protein